MSRRPKLVFLPLDEFYLTPTSTLRAWAASIAEKVPGIDIAVVDPADDLPAALGDADAAFGRLTPELLGAAPNLRWLQAPAAAPPPGYFFPELAAHPVIVTNLRGIYRANVADHAMAYVLAFARRLPTFLASQARREWHRAPQDAGIVDLGATTALVVGVGAVGTAIAERCRAFGMRVIGVDARPESVDIPLDALHPPGDLDEILPLVDWVILTVPHTPDTEGMMTLDRFRRMKPTAFFINIGRGPTVPLEDLTAALRAGEIAGAGLDVFEKEPLPDDHPLWSLPDVILTPHVAGFGADLGPAREELLVDNARRFVEGRPLRNVVDKEKWF
jgi:phosphoglycerate dehydrogenase-like enzyme